VVKGDKCMGVSQLLGALTRAAPPVKSTPMLSGTLVDSVVMSTVTCTVSGQIRLTQEIWFEISVCVLSSAFLYSIIHHLHHHHIVNIFQHNPWSCDRGSLNIRDLANNLSAIGVFLASSSKTYFIPSQTEPIRKSFFAVPYFICFW